MKLAPYPDYKDAGVSWVGSIPAHWPEKRAKYYFKEIDDRSQAGDEEMLSVSHITGVTPRSQKNVTMFKAESNVGQKRCQPGDLIINTMWAWMSALGVSRHEGIVSPAYGVYRPKKIQNYDPYYLDRLLRIKGYQSEYICRSTGIRSSRLRLYPDKFLGMRIVCPPLDEQIAIARFLKRQDALVSKFIRNKKRQIELLQERRNVLTYEAIKSKETRWLRFGVVADQVGRPIGREDDLVYTPIGLFNRGRGIFHKEATQGRDLGDSTFFWVKPGDLVFSGQFAWEGAVAIAQPKDDGCIASHRYPIFTNKPEIVEAGYLYSFFTTKDGDLLLNLHSRGAAGRNRPLNPRTLMKEKIPIPPLNLQQQIAEVLELEFKFRNDIARQISFIQEHRARVISDVVTGQVDVRGIEVPDVAEDELLALEEDTTDADDVIDDEGDMDETD
jgi:type I restriction enzyme S subunit